MGVFSAVAFGFILEASVSMGCKDNVDGEINDTIIFIYSNVIKELFDGFGSVFSVYYLLVSD